MTDNNNKTSSSGSSLSPTEQNSVVPSIDFQMSRRSQPIENNLALLDEHYRQQQQEQQQQQEAEEQQDHHQQQQQQQKCSSNGIELFTTNQYKGPKIWINFVKNWSVISQPLALLIVFFLIWAIAFSILPDYTGPSSTIMRIAYLFIGAEISGILVTFIRLPDMLGMLFWGVLYTNIGLSDFSGYQGLEAFLREMALVNIMLLAGFGLDLKAFKKLYGMIMRLTLIPTAVEVITIAVLAYLLLEMPWLWGTLLGLIITAVSPNVVVTVMLKLKEERLGLNNGIHTLIYAMTTCNDVVSIFFFGVILGVIFSTGTLTEQLLQGPIGIGVGVVFGFLYGLLILFIPSKQSKYANGLRFVMTILGGTISVMGSKAIGYPSAGALGCVMVSFVAGIGWQRQRGNENLNVSERLDTLWSFLKPISFSLIGKEVNFAVLDGTVVAYGLAIILVGVLFRIITSYLSTYGGNLTWKERIYVTISGFPKATVQAALGPIALDLARSLNSSENLELANNVLVVSVLAIIFTAPLGALLMIRLAPVLLKKVSEENEMTGTVILGAVTERTTVIPQIPTTPTEIVIPERTERNFNAF